MKRVFLLLGIAAAGSLPGGAATLCIPGTLASYVLLGSGGCMIASDSVSNFQILAGTAGSSPIDPATVAITPSGTSGAPALTFDLTVNTTRSLEAFFNYRISGATFTGSTITGSNATVTGDGSVTDIQNLCGAGNFGANGVTGCSGTSLGPLVIISPDTASITFPGVSFLSVTDDIVVDGGTSGSAKAGRFVDQFSATAVSTVPEPGTILITGLGAALFFTSKKLRSRRSN